MGMYANVRCRIFRRPMGEPGLLQFVRHSLCLKVPVFTYIIYRVFMATGEQLQVAG